MTLLPPSIFLHHFEFEELQKLLDNADKFQGTYDHVHTALSLACSTSTLAPATKHEVASSHITLVTPNKKYHLDLITFIYKKLGTNLFTDDLSSNEIFGSQAQPHLLQDELHFLILLH